MPWTPRWSRGATGASNNESTVPPPNPCHGGSWDRGRWRRSGRDAADRDVADVLSLADQAKVALADARAIALKARPGVITDQELEREKGGSGLRYSFDLKSAGLTYEVGVDAKTGKVLENDREGPNAD